MYRQHASFKGAVLLLQIIVCSIILSTNVLYAQTKTITVKGYITTDKGEPLPDVSINIKGAEKGTKSLPNGSFQITAPAGSTLTVSYVGYINKEVKLGASDQLNLTVPMLVNKNELDQVIVVGYGTRKKSDVTGAITSISEQAIQDVPVANLSQALQGQGAGIDVQKNGGNSKPGQAPLIFIRGARSVKASNTPLFVVDGIPFEGNINDINQDDVASVEVLKDASSTAIYGSRGANGVILVTTKRGKAGMRKPIVSYNGYTGFSKSMGEYPMMNGPQYLQLKKWANFIGGNAQVPSLGYTGPDDPRILTASLAPEELYGVSIGRSTDWQKLVYQTGIVTNHQLGVMGGNEITQYAMSAGYYNETGVYPGQSFERFSLKISIDQQLGKFIKVGVSSLNSFGTTKGENANPMSQALRASPLASPYDTSGNLINYFVPGSANQVWNPLDNFLPGASVETRKRLGTFTTLYVDATLARGLKYRFNTGADIRSDVYGNFYASNTTNNMGGASSANNQTSLYTNYTLENILTYDHTFAGKHRVSLTGLYSYQQKQSQNNSFSYTGLLSDNAQYFNPALGFNLSGTGSLSPTTTISYMGRVNYAYNDKYLLTLTLRSDASSVLANGNKQHAFPSAAVGWNLMKEKFLDHSRNISNLKLRASYGSVGNPSISPYQTLGSLTTQVYNYGTVTTTGLYPNGAPNPSLHWEYTSTLNVGVDFGFFQNRISGSLEFYHAYTKDMIMPVSLPATSGIPNATLTNIGKSENKGIELHISTVNLQAKTKNGLTWTTDLNIYINRGQITQLLPTINTTVDGKPADLANKWFVGQPIGSYYDYKKIGIWQATAADTALAQSLNQTLTGVGSVIGQVKVAKRDGNNTKTIDANDMFILGSPQPKWEGGMTNRFAYKNFDFTVVMAARVGGMISSTLFGGGFANTLQANYNNVNVDYWTPNNPTNMWPKANSGQTNPQKNSTLGYFDGTYLKIRSLSLGYNLPQSVMKKLGTRSIRVYTTVSDAFILFSPYRNKYHGIDPETAGTSSSSVNGTLNVDTPATWSMIFGVNVSL